MKRSLALLFLLLTSCMVHGKSDTDILLDELNKAIADTRLYDAEKLKRIGELKNSLQAGKNRSLPAQYEVTLKLYEEYKVFNFDSAFLYANKLKRIALQLNDPAAINFSKIKLSFILLSAGMFKETFDSLNEMDIRNLPDSMKAEYYSLMGRYYYDLAIYDNDAFHSPVYTYTGSRYMDSALSLYPAQSFDYYFFNGLKSLKQNKIDEALADYETLYQKANLSLHEKALVTSTLSSIYIKKGQLDKAIEFQTRASIFDVKSSTKEVYAIFNLAQLLFEYGDWENAYLYIEKAIADASFYGARQRKVQISSILPIIQRKKISYIEGQRKVWIIYGAVVTLLLVTLIFLIVTINRQVNKLKSAKRIIVDAHNNLREANAKLLEANKIKEEYIGYFFNINSDFFQKMERFKKTLEQKVADRKLEEIKFIVNAINIRQEKEDLLKNFDQGFLKLFPNFVVEFNALFNEDEKIKLKDNESLNTDLRIFALIRMGITDNEKIARILEYSVNTIYAYKTKIKNRAIVPKEEFEKRVMEIKSI